jgi:hypothetical protein
MQGELRAQIGSSMSLDTQVYEAIRAILECLGLPNAAPPVAPAEPEAEQEEIDPGLATLTKSIRERRQQ